jgi:hypothetical protein
MREPFAAFKDYIELALLVWDLLELLVQVLQP